MNTQRLAHTHITERKCLYSVGAKHNILWWSVCVKNI